MHGLFLTVAPGDWVVHLLGSKNPLPPGFSFCIINWCMDVCDREKGWCSSVSQISCKSVMNSPLPSHIFTLLNHTRAQGQGMSLGGLRSGWISDFNSWLVHP